MTPIKCGVKPGAPPKGLARRSGRLGWRGGHPAGRGCGEGLVEQEVEEVVPEGPVLDELHVLFADEAREGVGQVGVGLAQGACGHLGQQARFGHVAIAWSVKETAKIHPLHRMPHLLRLAAHHPAAALPFHHEAAQRRGAVSPQQERLDGGRHRSGLQGQVKSLRLVEKDAEMRLQFSQVRAGLLLALAGVEVEIAPEDAGALSWIEDAPALPLPGFHVVDVQGGGFARRREEHLVRGRGHQLDHGGHGGDEVGRDAGHSHAAPVDERQEAGDGAHVGRPQHDEFADVRRPGIRGNGRLLPQHVLAAVEDVVAGDEAAHGVGYDVHLDGRVVAPPGDAADEGRQPPGILHAAQAPVVGEGEERGLGHGPRPLYHSVATVLGERLHNARVDLHPADLFDGAHGHEVRLLTRSDGQGQTHVGGRREEVAHLAPQDFPRLWVHDLRAHEAMDAHERWPALLLLSPVVVEEPQVGLAVCAALGGQEQQTEADEPSNPSR